MSPSHITAQSSPRISARPLFFTIAQPPCAIGVMPARFSKKEVNIPSSALEAVPSTFTADVFAAVALELPPADCVVFHICEALLGASEGELWRASCAIAHAGL